MSVNSDEEETIDKELFEYWKPKRMSEKELMEHWKAVQSKTGHKFQINAFSKKPLDPNRSPRLPAKLSSRLDDEVDHQPNTRIELPVPWDWQHCTAHSKKSPEPKPPAPMQKK